MPGKVIAAVVTLALSLAPSASARDMGERPGKALIAKLIGLAETGGAANPDRVARALGVTFTPHTRGDDAATACPSGKSLLPGEYTTYTASRPLGPTPFGHPTTVVAGFGMINAKSTTIVGPTQITYNISRVHDCSGYVQSRNNVEITLEIAPLPPYDCMDGGELRGWFPRVEQGYATDGAEVFYYNSAAMARRGVSLTVTGFVTTPCTLSVTLNQRSDDTLRHRVARQRQEACMLPHEQAFCRSHKPFGWGDGDVQDEMATAAVRQCGTLDTFIARTPATAKLAPTPVDDGSVDPDTSTPCSRIDRQLAKRRRR